MDALDAAWHGRDVDLGTESDAALAAMRGCPQTAAFHGEGDVAAHATWVYDLAREHAQTVVADGAPAAGIQAATLRLAALLHDAGKPGTTVEVGPRVYSSRGHDEAGARLVSALAQTHPLLVSLPLGTYVSAHTLVRDHMWTYAADRISPGAALRMTHLTDPRLLMALWDADARGRICDDAQDVADRVEYARLVLHDLGAATPDSFGLLDIADPQHTAAPRARRETFRALVEGHLTDAGAVAAHLAASERHTTGASLTYTMGLPGVGKSTWARTVWQEATGGVVLSNEGARRRDRRDATAAVYARIPALLAAGVPVCVDATHLVRQTRDVLVRFADRYGAGLHAVWFRAPLRLSLQRQTTRAASDAVPDAVIETMARKVRWPSPDEYETLTVVEPTGAMWDYSPATRWLPAEQAPAAAPVTGGTWSGRAAVSGGVRR